MLIDFDYLFKKYNIEAEGVLHVGANRGQEAEAYHNHGIKTVIWVEAVPSVYEDLCRNVERYPETACLLACVSDVDGDKIKFNVSNNEEQSSSMLQFGTHKDVHPTVKFVDTIDVVTVRLDTILKGFNMEYYTFLNLDLQGSELKALRGLGMLLHGFDYIYTELNCKETYIDCALVDEVDAYLEKFNFTRVETTTWIGNTWADGFYIKKKHLLL